MGSKSSYEGVQARAFSALVQDGTYSENFDHSTQAQEFFYQVMSPVLEQLKESREGRLSVLDCGCGNGAWLDFLTGLPDADSIESVFGYDLTPDMVAVAKKRLSKKGGERISLQAGNILDSQSYSFPGHEGGFDLVYTYDVIQQLPPPLQFRACQTLLEYTEQGGAMVVFDNDGKSKFGRKMARKKFLTRYLGLPLVPRYYCNAKYPPLQKFADALLASDLDVEIIVSESGMKRALIARKPAN